MSLLLSLIFTAIMLCLTGAAFALIFKNLSDINKLERKPRRHPELEELKEGDELLVVKFKPEIDEAGTVDIKFTPDDKFTDRLLDKSLRKRIQELSPDPWDDEDDGDGDGDVPAVVRR
tara:strand:- start:27 stop:380 length:354 start_codon:yes stop_codon:yes gene_type:complete